MLWGDYEITSEYDDFPEDKDELLDFFYDSLGFTDGDEDGGYFNEQGAEVRLHENQELKQELQIWKASWPADSLSHEWFTVENGKEAFEELFE